MTFAEKKMNRGPFALNSKVFTAMTPKLHESQFFACFLVLLWVCKMKGFRLRTCVSKILKWFLKKFVSFSEYHLWSGNQCILSPFLSVSTFIFVHNCRLSIKSFCNKSLFKNWNILQKLSFLNFNSLLGRSMLGSQAK